MYFGPRHFAMVIQPQFERTPLSALGLFVSAMQSYRECPCFYDAFIKEHERFVSWLFSHHPRGCRGIAEWISKLVQKHGNDERKAFDELIELYGQSDPPYEKLNKITEGWLFMQMWPSSSSETSGRMGTDGDGPLDAKPKHAKSQKRGHRAKQSTVREHGDGPPDGSLNDAEPPTPKP